MNIYRPPGVVVNSVCRSSWGIAFYCALVAGCGQGSPDPGRVAIPANSPAPTAPATGHPGRVAPPPPQVLWDNPDPDGVVTDLTHAAEAGHLPFPVADPGFGRPPALVKVSNPVSVPAARRLLSMAYRFPTGTPEFPTDGRLTLYISPTDISIESLIDSALVQDPDVSYELLQVPGGVARLSRSTQGSLGSLLMVRNGLKYDIHGPAIPAATIRLLTEDLVGGATLSPYTSPAAVK